MLGDCSTGCQNMMWLLVHDFGICENWGKFMKGIGTISGNATRRVAWCRTQNKRFSHSKKLAIAC
jgi:hypothetical protein